MEAKAPTLQYCLLCYKSCDDNFKSGSQLEELEKDYENPKGSVDDKYLSSCQLLFKTICRLLNLGDDRLAAGTGVLHKFAIGGHCWRLCKDCFRIGEYICDTNHQIQGLQLQLNWKLAQILDVVKYANCIPTRWLNFKSQFGDGEHQQSQLEDAMRFRNGFKSKCSKKLKNAPPKVSLQRCHPLMTRQSCGGSESQILDIHEQTSNASREDDKEILLKTMLSFLSVISLSFLNFGLYSPCPPLEGFQDADFSEESIGNRSASFAAGEQSLEEHDYDGSEQIDFHSDNGDFVEDGNDTNGTQSVENSQPQKSLLENTKTEGCQELQESEALYITTNSQGHLQSQTASLKRKRTPEKNPLREYACTASPSSTTNTPKKIKIFSVNSVNVDHSSPRRRKSLRSLLKCNLCTKTFTSKPVLETHLESHNKMKLEQASFNSDNDSNAGDGCDRESNHDSDDNYEIGFVAASDSDEDVVMDMKVPNAKEPSEERNNEGKVSPVDNLQHPAPEKSGNEDASLKKIKHLKSPKKKRRVSQSPKRVSDSHKSVFVSETVPRATITPRPKKILTDPTLAGYCEFCKETLSCKAELEKHRALVHKFAHYVHCPTCGIYHENFNSLTDHFVFSPKCKQKAKKVDPKLLKPGAVPKFPFNSTAKLAGKFFCPHEGCYEVFNHKVWLDFHVKTHGNWECKFCSEPFKKLYDLAEHEITTHKYKRQRDPWTIFYGPESKYGCARCSYSEQKKYLIISHFIHVHCGFSTRTNSYEHPTANKCETVRERKDNGNCPLCHQLIIATKSTKSNAMKLHIKAYHDFDGVDAKNIIKCKECQAPFLRESHVLRHIRIMHPNVTPFECKLCQKKFPTSNKLRQHIRINHKGEPGAAESFGGHIPCPQCGERFTTDNRFKLHLQKHEKDKDGIICQVCKEKFESRLKLNNHIKWKHKPNSFICEQCGKGFKTRYSLETHELYHAGSEKWQFVCEEEGCGRRFATKQKLAVHKRVHTKEKPFICETCGKAYGHRHNLRNHVKSAHKDAGLET